MMKDVSGKGPTDVSGVVICRNLEETHVSSRI